MTVSVAFSQLSYGSEKGTDDKTLEDQWSPRDTVCRPRAQA